MTQYRYGKNNYIFGIRKVQDSSVPKVKFLASKDRTFIFFLLHFSSSFSKIFGIIFVVNYSARSYLFNGVSFIEFAKFVRK